ncbi:unnamed protein product [Mycena citricolor]|uniref:Uncharacterized protein n=1 Tax=Mycena citricolor TaxID=2018698 RepID=A0AAD2Q3D4_9AGAR|nr:unnamed protein product [Mycena citricolor]
MLGSIKLCQGKVPHLPRHETGYRGTVYTPVMCGCQPSHLARNSHTQSSEQTAVRIRRKHRRVGQRRRGLAEINREDLRVSAFLHRRNADRHEASSADTRTGSASTRGSICIFGWNRTNENMLT